MTSTNIPHPRSNPLARHAPLLLAPLGLLALALVSPPRLSAQSTITVEMAPLNSSGVSGTALLTAAGDGTRVLLNIQGLEPNTRAEVQLHSGSCTAPSASFSSLPDLIADEGGHAQADGMILFRGQEPVALPSVADAEHVITIATPGRILACSPIVGAAAPAATVAPAPAQPTPPPTPDSEGWGLVGLLGVITAAVILWGVIWGRRRV